MSDFIFQYGVILLTAAVVTLLAGLVLAALVLGRR
jgi:hypothetical protein